MDTLSTLYATSATALAHTERAWFVTLLTVLAQWSDPEDNAELHLELCRLARDFRGDGEMLALLQRVSLRPIFISPDFCPASPAPLEARVLALLRQCADALAADWTPSFDLHAPEPCPLEAVFSQSARAILYFVAQHDGVLFADLMFLGLDYQHEDTDFEHRPTHHDFAMLLSVARAYLDVAVDSAVDSVHTQSEDGSENGSNDTDWIEEEEMDAGSVHTPTSSLTYDASPVPLVDDALWSGDAPLTPVY